MNPVVLILLCWLCLAVGVLIGHFTWPRPERVEVPIERAAAEEQQEQEPPKTQPIGVRGRHAARTGQLPAQTRERGRP